VENKMNFNIAYIRHLLKKIDTQTSGSGSGGNPSGGTVDVATTNYQAALLQQWITLELGSASAVSMNLLSSILEPFNLYVSTSFYNGTTVPNFAINDVVHCLVAGTSTYLPGFINPAHLRLAAHFQGTGNIPNSVVAGDAPVYNSNTTTLAKLALSNSTVMTPPTILVGGTPAASSVAPISGAIANAFDANASTYWASLVTNLLPTADGVPSALDINANAINAFDGKSSTSWDTGIINGYTRYPGTVTSSNGGTPTNAFNSTGYGIGNNQWLKWDMGAGKQLTITKYSWYGNGTSTLKGYVLAGSNDDSNWTTVDSRGGVGGSTGTFTFTCNGTTGAFRYYKITTNDYWSSGPTVSQLTYYVNLTGAPTYLRYDLGVDQSLVGTGYIISSTGSNTPKSWKLQGSNDASSWDDLESVTNYAGAFPYSGTFANATAYRYYQLLISDSSNADHAQVAVTDFKVTGVGAISPFLATNPQTLSYDLGESALARVVTRYTVNSSVYTPTDWLFQGSNNNVDWTTLDTVAAYASTFPVTRSFANTAPYRYFRIYVTGASGNNDVVRIIELSADNLPVVSAYDTGDKVFGSSSAKLMYYYQKGTAVQNINHLKLSNNDWRFSGFYKFQAGFPMPQCLFAILGKELEILATANGLRVNYSTDGSNFVTVNSNAYAFAYDTWYWITVGRTGTTLSMSVSPVSTGVVASLGTADLTGVTFFTTASNNFYIGADVAGANPFIGHIQEVEFFVGENPTPVMPVAARSTAYIPAVSWETTSTYIPTGTASIGAIIFIDETTYASFGVPTNGEFVFSVSIDNGATYHPVTMTRDGSLTTNTRIYKGTISLTGLTNTNQFKYKLTSVANKVLKYDGAIIYWL
jgi:hypothetical protein